MARVPKSWDGALEALLQTTKFTSADVRWSDRIVDNVSESQTFVEAIHRTFAANALPTDPKKGAIDPTRARENHIRRMVLAPLSPRKPIVIPCPIAAVRQRDKQKLERVIRQRTAASAVARLAIPAAVKANTRPYRTVLIAKRDFSSMKSMKRTFYWGA
jgi:hypothetical protein